MDDALQQQLRTEFLEDAGERLDSIQAAIDGIVDGSRAPAEALTAVRRETHAIKGQAGNFGFPLVSTIAHRMEDFVDGEATLTSELGRNVQVFADTVREIVETGREPGHKEGDELLRGLPAKQAAQDLEIQVLDVEVLLGTPSRTSARMVRDVLQNCGYRVVRAETGIDCFTLAMRSRPDAMLLAFTLEEVSGGELVRAFNAMPSMTTIPMAILTSFEPGHPQLAQLPDGVSVVRTKKTHFDDDMGAFLARIQAEVL